MFKCMVPVQVNNVRCNTFKDGVEQILIEEVPGVLEVQAI